jgi:CBS domain-containing protein
MSKIQTYASPDTPVEVAVQRMVNHKIRRLPIVSDGKVVGIVTVTDLARQLRSILLVDGILSEET